ncbi:MAG: D-sedoheptulose 7-phosphate isomerase [Tepidiphilus sp.]|jgi:D-sedoheptulose 7-phosphate isomerase|uniref:D-sedoheptulose 7-phosphate isomerase n=1 Tax=Thauera propionica TaxID=2019431 RepID=UPI001B6C2B04|nr:D-sedoheptulose 7-phosphate isomerase [Thauera propionica]MBP6999698.1 D-sedoheptulose 7-phosphate isomerase [Tepidiphilus sp.]MDD3677556.1 D-sedoheptulose 7-phosphate isomerase [Thauera propionica]
MIPEQAIRQALSAHRAATEQLHEQMPLLIEMGMRLRSCLLAGGKILLLGNGGSAADCQHIAAEIVGRYKRERRGLPAIALTTDTSILTAVGNDYGFEHVFSRQVEALCTPKDVVIGLSTSGNSPNVLAAIHTARQIGAFTIGLTGGGGGKLAQCCDLSLVVASNDTPRIQEAHILVGHMLCDLIDAETLDSTPCSNG